MHSLWKKLLSLLMVLALLFVSSPSFAGADIALVAEDEQVPQKGYVAIAAGSYHNLAIGSDGTVVAWGDNEFAQSSVPATLANIVGIAASGYSYPGGPDDPNRLAYAGYSLAVDDAGEVYAWGSNSLGQCAVPEDLGPVRQVGAGFAHSVALRMDGTVSAWGDNRWGQCDVPEGLSDVTSIAVGNHHNIAVKQDGTVVAWGDNTYGQCDVPEGTDDVIAAAAGDYHTVLVHGDRTVTAFGRNSWGQLNVPEGLSQVKAVAAGFGHTIALRQDGTMIAWGFNGNGESTIPEGAANIVAIAASGLHSVALNTAGRILTWGMYIESPFSSTFASGEYECRRTGGTIELTGYTGSSSHVEIPSELEGFPVISIGASSFADHDELQSIMIPSSIMRIGYSAFSRCTTLTEVQFPTSLAEIGDGAFSGCTALTGIELPTSLTKIGSGAFSSCSALETIFIPDTVTMIGGSVFRYCSNLEEIVVDPDNQSYASLNGVLFDKTISTLWLYPEAKQGDYVAPESVVSINAYVFYGIASLTSITFGEHLAQIGDYVFTGCANLKKATFTGDAPSLGVGAFDQCDPSFSVAYMPNTSGFTTPTWNGYPCSVHQTDPVEETPSPGTSPTSGQSGGGVLAPAPIMTPADGATLYEPDKETEADKNVQVGLRLNVSLETESHRLTAVMDNQDAQLLLDALQRKNAAGELSGTDHLTEILLDTGDASGVVAVPSAIDLSVPGSLLETMALTAQSGLRIRSVMGTLTFPPEALSTISGVGEATVSFHVEQFNASDIAEMVPASLMDRPVYAFEVNRDATLVSDFGSAVVTVSVPYVLKAGEDPNCIVVLHLKNDGTVAPVIGRYDAVTGQVVFETTHFSQFVLAYKANSFADVSPTSTLYPAVRFLSARGITLGVGGNQFAPTGTLTRGQYMTFLMRTLVREATAADLAATFSDSLDGYYAGPVALAKRLGIAVGTGGGLFSPEKGLTRQEMVTLTERAWRLLARDLPDEQIGDVNDGMSGFPDADMVASWAIPSYDLFAAYHLLPADGELLNPTTMATRADMASLLYALLK